MNYPGPAIRIENLHVTRGSHEVFNSLTLSVSAGALIGLLGPRGTTLLISSHVLDEATRCDRLMLLRREVILADETPDGLLGKTGTTTAEAAFLVLIAGDTHGVSGEERWTSSVFAPRRVAS